ncbi:hypothetical protein CAter282_2172 [Collimonas arenae]|uniref:Uncharacterized protein n=3 Tax=Collimonas arenae TaxID=279058 RepID=A0A127QIU4_9BURK|nr:hypothetical protein CAter10_2366 [Collimonas arenae]AMP09926.1 hypothetical protein CAter282_2172 [Collimonas arenae]
MDAIEFLELWVAKKSYPANIEKDQMKSTPNVLPWKNTSCEMECNLAMGHLLMNLQPRLQVNGRVHAETYIAAVGAIAGYAAQRTLFAETPPVVGHNIHRVGTKSGEQYWFGDALNNMLMPKTEADGSRCLWSLAAGGALGAGLQPQQIPNLDAMFKHVVSTIGGANEGRSSVPAQHQAHFAARDLLKLVWPLALTCLSGKIPGAKREFGAAPIAWWSAITAQASNRPIQDVKQVLAPDVALTLLMESAIYCSKLDQSSIEST